MYRSVVALDAKQFAVSEVNRALAQSNPDLTLTALQHPALGIQSLDVSAATLFHSELAYIRDGSNADLRLEGILGLCEFLGTIAKINSAIRGKNSNSVWIELNNTEVWEGVANIIYVDMHMPLSCLLFYS